MTQPLAARRLVAADSAAVADVLAAAMPHAWSVAQVEGTLRAPSGLGLALPAEAASVPEAVALLQVAAGEAELLVLAVRPRSRRQGLGRALLAEALAAVRARGAESVHCELRAGNSAALELYAGAGLVLTGRRRRYYPDGEDALTGRFGPWPAGGAPPS